MKWYVGLQAEIVAAIVGIVSLSYIKGQDQPSLPLSTQNSLILIVFLISFVGGFMAPYHVMKTAKYAATSFSILVGIPLVFILVVIGDISQDNSGDFGSVIVLIIFIVAAIALVISIVVVTLILFIGGYIGSIFGKMVFNESRYEDKFQSSKYHQPQT